MTTTVSSIGKHQAVQAVGGASGAPAASAAAPGDMLPAPNTDLAAAKGDVMTMLYALTAKQRDTNSTQRAASAQRKGTEREQAFEQMREEIQKAKDAKEDGGWLSDVTNVLDAAADAVVGGNPLQDVAHRLSESTGIEQFDIAYDFIRPDAILHGAVLLASAATGEDKIAQGYDMVAGSSSLKTRFQAAADTSGKADEVMDAYKVTRDAVAMAMVTVGTCGTGTAAVFAVASSAALTLESKLDLLGKMGVDDKSKMGIRLGAQAYMVAGNIGTAFALGKSAVAAGKAAVSIINGANQISRGGVQVGQAIYEHESSEHLANAAGYENTQHRADREQQRLIAGLREISTSYQRSLETIASTLNERDQSSLLLAQHIA